jgi:hypothetical protein
MSLTSTMAVLVPNIGRGTTLIALGLSVVAFILALRIRSLVVASFLTVAGVMMWTPALATIIAERAIVYPGPILGIISFSPMGDPRNCKFCDEFEKQKERQCNSSLCRQNCKAG